LHLLIIGSTVYFAAYNLSFVEIFSADYLSYPISLVPANSHLKYF